ncbi:hypothetical protein [Ruegeria lacuscaerulensis]|uniref:hypothetical protein n=1 Tax=Ruegeria lacuscaerulensis TaxID=55218 RepID=UPI00147EB6E6|nr:hypothetical protein [Ruegeria lacuscaerulensis]
MTFVRTQAEYHAALREIEYLWGSESDTEEGRKLDEYLAAVEQYEQLFDIAPDMQATA